MQERAVKFVEEVAKRYVGNKNIILWHTRNETRNRPVDECFCPHCRRAFGKYLEKKFGTIENLNATYGAAGVYERRMTGGKKIIFIFNNSGCDKTFDLDGEIVSFGADATVCDGRMTVKSGEIGYVIVK